MKRLSFVVFFFLMLTSSLLSAPFATPGNQAAVLRTDSQNPTGYGFYEYLPIGYSSMPDRKWPLVIYLHGLGEQGYANDLTTLSEVIKNNGPNKQAASGKDWSFISFAPQDPMEAWNMDHLDSFVDWILQNYRVDRERIYVTGLSMGGGGTCNYSVNFMEKLAAAVPVCTTGLSDPSRVVDLPMWYYHNEFDGTVGVGNSINAYNDTVAAGGRLVYLTVYAGVSGHDAWTATYNDVSMWGWLTNQTKHRAGQYMSNFRTVPGELASDRSIPMTISIQAVKTNGPIKSVKLDLTSIGGPASVDMVPAGGSLYTYSWNTPSSLTPGNKTIRCFMEDYSTNRRHEQLIIKVIDSPLPGDVNGSYLSQGVNRVTWTPQAMHAYKVYCSTNAPFTSLNKGSANVLVAELPDGTSQFDHVMSNYPFSDVTHPTPFYYAVAGLDIPTVSGMIAVTNLGTSWDGAVIWYQSAWNDDINVVGTGNTTLQFYIKNFAGSQPVLSQMILRLADKAGGNSSIPFSSFITYLSNKWQKITLPITSFGAVNFSRLSSINIPRIDGGPGTCNIGVDEISFTGSASPFVWYGESHPNNPLSSGANIKMGRLPSGGLTGVPSTEHFISSGVNATLSPVINSVGPMVASGVKINSLTASPNSISDLVATSILFAANCVDTNGSITNVTVNLSALGGGSVVVMKPAGGNNFTNRMMVAAGQSVGNKTVTVRAVDDSGNSLTRDVIVSVTHPANRVGIDSFTASPASVSDTVSTLIVFKAHAISTNGTVTNLSLNLSTIGGGASVKMIPLPGNNYSNSYLCPSGLSVGVKNITAIAKDDNANSTSRNLNVTVYHPASGILISAYSVSPSSLEATTGGTVTFTASVSDTNGSITNVRLNLSSLGGASSVIMNPLGGNNYNLNYTVPAGLSVGSRSILMTSADNSGNTRSSNISFNLTSSVGAELYTVKINFSSTPSIATNMPGVTETWNNISSSGGAAVTRSGYNDVNNVPRGVGVQLMQGWGGDNVTGVNTGNNSGIVPDAVLQSFFYQGTAGVTNSIRFFGLPTNQQYTFQFVGSRASPKTDNRTGWYRIGTKILSLNSSSNYLNSADFSNVNPNASGEIYAYISRDAAAQYAYINAVIIKAFTKSAPDSIPPSTPTLVGPVDLILTNSTSLQLKWNRATDASGVAGYQVVVGSVSNWISSATNTMINSLMTGAYSWKVRARDNAGNYGLFSPVRTFTIDVSGPAAVSLKTPAANMTNKLQNVTYSWNSSPDVGVAGTVAYQIEVGTTTNNLSSTNLAVTKADGVYLWQVRARDSLYNYGAWSVSRIITIDSTPPTQPSLLLPADASTLISTAVTIRWSSGNDLLTGVKGFQLQTSIDSTFTSPNTRNLANTNFNTNVADSTMLYWRIRSFDKAGNTNAWTSYRYFTVSTNQIIPSLLSPNDGVLTNNALPVFKWSTSASASRYWIEVRTNDISGKVVASNTNCLVGSCAFSSLPSGRYFWRVKAFKTAGSIWQSWNSGNSLIIDLVAPVPVSGLLPYEGIVTNDVTPTLAWNPSSDASGIAGYQVVLDGVASDLPGTSMTTVALSDGTHFWKVRTRDSAGNWSLFSSSNSLVIDTQGPNAPTLLLPVQGFTNFSASVTFTWNAAGDVGLSGVKDYRFVLDNFTNFQTGLTRTVSSLSEGTHTWSVCARDNEGNLGAVSSRQFVVVTADTLPPPTVQLLSPANNAETTSGQPLFVWGSVSDTSGIKGYQIVIGSMTNFVAGNVTNFTPISPLVAGVYDWSVRAIDDADNRGPFASSWKLNVKDPLPANNPEMNTIKASPNPLKTSDGQTVMTFHFSVGEEVENVRIEIYSITGSLIRVLDGSGGSQQLIWDAKNLSGKLVASGTYLVLLVADGRNVLKRPYKVGIIR